MEREKIRTALVGKGFAEGGGDHDFYYLQVDGKRASVFTKLSRGSKYRDLGPDLVGQICRQIGLTKKELVEYVDCTLTLVKYVELLRQKNRIQ